jgi:hypothetical protein
MAHCIVPLNVDGRISKFGYLSTSNVDDESTSFSLQLMDYDSSRREACLADVISSGNRHPRYYIDRVMIINNE